MKCYRKILRISWKEKEPNKEVLSRLDMKTTILLQKAKTLKLKYFGHIKRHETLERHILEARIDGRRGRGRPTRRWEQDINDWMDMTTTQAGRLAEDRVLFRQKVQEATSRQEINWSRKSSRDRHKANFTHTHTQTVSMKCKWKKWSHKPSLYSFEWTSDCCAIYPLWPWGPLRLFGGALRSMMQWVGSMPWGM